MADTKEHKTTQTFPGVSAPEPDRTAAQLANKVREAMCPNWDVQPHGGCEYCARNEESLAALDALVAERDQLREALAQATDVIEWCGQNDKTPHYTYDPALASTRRRDGELPGQGKAFNTPAEFARFWVPQFRAALSAVAPPLPPPPQDAALAVIEAARPLADAVGVAYLGGIGKEVAALARALSAYDEAGDATASEVQEGRDD